MTDASPFGIYLHWPFCAAKCPYCDFNSHVSATIDQDAWQTAYLAEVDRVAAEVGPRTVTSVFFGGGTPSLMEPAVTAAVLDRIAARFTLAEGAEITLEANPGSVEAGRFAGFRAAGINRVSVGVQALNDRDLRRLGRVHSADEAIQAVEIASKIFDRSSFDLIYARQAQRLSDWKAELEQALSMGMSHLSLYQLTIEDGTVFGRRHAAGKLPDLPDEDEQADMFALTQETTAAAGLSAYEISNHARPGQESRHNLIYWQAGDYAGIGPGSHGRLTLGGRRYATETYLAPKGWLNAVRTKGSGEGNRAEIGPEDQFRERMLMGLRLMKGVRFDPRDPGLPAEFWAAVAELETLGLLERIGGGLRLTFAGRPLLDSVLARLFRGH
jgi:putative oxygen-independent coproporphyrinogen III oxidase